jgi:hypothetical protein
MKIGITFVQKEPGDSIWTNGIKLNALILAKMLMSIKSVDDVYLINRHDIQLDQTTPWDIEKYKMVNEEQALELVDVILILGGAISDDYIQRFKSKNPSGKVVAYHCGNHYVLETEKVLFGENLETNKPLWNQLIDESWVIPQQEYHNLYYTHTFNRKPVRVVPFVWDPEHVQLVADSIKESDKFKNEVPYNPGTEKKRIAVFEPNINIFKYAMIPVHITEWANWDPVVKDQIDFLSVTNGMNLLKNHEFTGHIKYLSIFKEKKIFMESRYNTPYFLADHTDIVLSHQWGNPLNYAYLDALYFGYPLVHNAEMIQDMGYYYQDFNIEQGAGMLKRAIMEHDLNHTQYVEKHNRLLTRYRADNPDIIAQYETLLENLMNGKVDSMINSGYDWQTNTIKK